MAHQADARRHLDERGYTGPLIHNDNPLKLFEKAVRDRVVDSYYWKEQCFGLNAATLLDRAVELTCIGGTFGVGQRPTPFLCLAFKLLQITPEREIIEFYLGKAGEEFKYLRLLAAFYVRLTYEKGEDVYTTLEPLLADFRKIRRRTREGWSLTHVDEFVDDLLQKSRLNPRTFLEDEGIIEPRESALGEELEELDGEGSEGGGNAESDKTSGDGDGSMDGDVDPRNGDRASSREATPEAAARSDESMAGD
ncbi:uncharacterized protein LTR77_001904 [Saxophila tyrrhenica]|uniref:Pre-mRNA-splicing factor 38 n=1 Tax=Saxophila tyrrhenica TaxID=1690608 RepID=A0AAV9PPW8_9PEZI|nr:hypothetical protein LTR77_001904 [Saxophila tyrrhenica]